MRRTCFARSRRWPACLVAALFALPLPVAAEASEWMPLRPGGRWEYSLHRDHTFEPAQGPIDRTFRNGRVVVEYVRRVEADGRRLHELVERRREDPLGAGLPPSHETLRLEWSDESGLALHSAGPTGRVPNRFDPALRMLPDRPAPGATWRVGTWRSGGTVIELQGEVVGFEDVEGGGESFPRCLVVRYTGPVSGSTPVFAGNASIRTGQYEQKVWMKQGVGVVKEVTVTRGELELPDDSTARVFETATRRLVEHRVSQ